MAIANVYVPPGGAAGYVTPPKPKPPPVTTLPPTALTSGIKPPGAPVAPPPPPSPPPPPPPPPPTTDTSAEDTAAAYASSPDPFKGTPYEGMSAYEIAMQIVHETQAQNQAIIDQQMQWLAANNSRDLQTLLGFSAALGQQSQDPFAGLQNSAQNFSQGYQDTMNHVMSGGQAPSPATAFNWGMYAQMYGPALEAKNSQDLAQAYAEAEAKNMVSPSDVFSLYQNIQGIFDAQSTAEANAAASAAAASADAAASAAAADRYTTEQNWKAYYAATAEAKRLTEETKVLHVVSYDPKTGRYTAKQARDAATGKLITLPGYSLGPGGVQKSSTASKSLKIDTTQSKLRGYLVYTDGSIYRDANGNPVRVPKPAEKKSIKPLSKAAQEASGLPYLAGIDQNGNVVAITNSQGKPIPYKPKTTTTDTTKKSQSSTVPGTPAFKQAQRKNVAFVSVSASKYAKDLKNATKGSISVKIDNNTRVNKPLKVYNTAKKADRMTIYNLVYRQYARALFSYYQALYPNRRHYQALVDKVIRNAVGWDAYGNY